MQMGFNNDVEYKRLTLHIQTEDHGLPAMKITSQVFLGGAIVDTKTMSYEGEIDGLEDEPRDERIRAIMKGLHRKFYQRIHEGIYDEKLPITNEAQAEADAAAAVDAPAAAPAKPVAPVAAESSDVGLEVPTDMIEAEGFTVAGEHAELGADYEANSRGAPMVDFEPETLRGNNIEALAAAASGPTGAGFVQLGGLGSGAHEIAEEVPRPAGKLPNAAVPMYGSTRAFQGLEVKENFGALLLEALSA